jgi:hypothetical protein
MEARQYVRIHKAKPRQCDLPIARHCARMHSQDKRPREWHKSQADDIDVRVDPQELVRNPADQPAGDEIPTGLCILGLLTYRLVSSPAVAHIHVMPQRKQNESIEQAHTCQQLFHVQLSHPISLCRCGCSGLDQHKRSPPSIVCLPLSESSLRHADVSMKCSSMHGG